MNVVFSHGKESGPWGTKIKEMAKIAESKGFKVDSIDYQGINDVDNRVNKLRENLTLVDGSVVLVGSSMGGYVATACSESLACKGLFVLAPAFYLGGKVDFDAVTVPKRTTVVHGWLDDIVPVENSWRFAKQHSTELHILNDGHRLITTLPKITELFSQFLDDIEA
ncbi:alpha/beta hydrolase [Idiomarina sp. X4]|uniref:alpha/beta hydrolase n=1 Tax=unclassified Idiomarina TaxID=2614829 RepID=UPI000C28ECD4|nr:MULTISPECIES: alpha/beta hydrolase [unclassified Idiomarina]ATZ74444.1 alpha/beta hydrolase [Idiomarina sp. X4]RXS44351.1 alpha/beta hydrolase [Idiomarina sp. 29L]